MTASREPPAGATRTPLESRFFPRAAVDLGAELCEGGATFELRVENISVGGAFLRPQAGVGLAPPVGSTLAVRVMLPDGPLDVRAVVVWVRTDATAGLAVRFDALSESAAGRVQRLVAELEPMAWEGERRGRALPRELASSFIPVLRRMAARLASSRPSSRTSPDDLVGAGFLGLVEAYRRWPSRTLAGFEPYALVRMRGAMIDELRRADELSRSQRRRSREIDKASALLRGGLGRRPDEAELADYLGISVEDYRAWQRELAAAQTVVLDDGLDPRADEPVPEEHVAQRQSLGRVEVALTALPDRLRRVLELYYGDELTLREIGNLLGVSESRISQLLSQAVTTLRARVGHDG